MKYNQKKKGQKSLCFIRNPRNADTSRHRAPVQPSPTLDGEWYQQYLETAVGAWPKNRLYTTLSHCTRPLWLSSCYISHPLEADLSRRLLSGTVFSNPNSDNYLWFCCWLERQLPGIESTFPSVQKLRVRRRGISVPASLSNTWHQMHMWGWPSKINEFNRREQTRTGILV